VSRPDPPEPAPTRVAPASPAAERDAEDDALARRAQGGDLAAFNVLVARHQDAVYSLARRFLSAPQPAEDAAQEAFLRAYQRLSTFRGGRFRAWLLQITANVARDELRRRRRRPQVSLDRARDDPDRPSLDPPDPGRGPEGAAENRELGERLERALGELPEEWRMVVLLSDVHGLSYPEISTATGLALGTVKSRLSRARARLRELLTATGEPGALDGRPTGGGMAR